MAGDRTFGEKTTSISNSLESGVKRSVARLKLLSKFCTRSGLFKISGFNDSSLCIRQDKHALSGWEGYEEWGLITYSLGAAFTKPTTAKAPFPPAALGLTSFVPKYTSFVLSAQPVAWGPAAKDKKRCFYDDSTPCHWQQSRLRNLPPTTNRWNLRQLGLTPISCKDSHSNYGQYSKMNEGECNLGIERYEACLARALYSLPFWRAVFCHQSLSSS
jgi:hypothetical protein